MTFNGTDGYIHENYTVTCTVERAYPAPQVYLTFPDVEQPFFSENTTSSQEADGTYTGA